MSAKIGDKVYSTDFLTWGDLCWIAEEWGRRIEIPPDHLFQVSQCLRHPPTILGPDKFAIPLPVHVVRDD